MNMTKTQDPAAIVAYDYDNQTWVVDPDRARTLRREQITRELALLKSATGERYCRFCGIADRAAFINRLQEELNRLCLAPAAGLSSHDYCRAVHAQAHELVAALQNLARNAADLEGFWTEGFDNAMQQSEQVLRKLGIEL